MRADIHRIARLWASILYPSYEELNPAGRMLLFMVPVLFFIGLLVTALSVLVTKALP